MAKQVITAKVHPDIKAKVQAMPNQSQFIEAAIVEKLNRDAAPVDSKEVIQPFTSKREYGN